MIRPDCELILIFRKPLEGTVAENVLKWGTGAINIDKCRVPVDREQERQFDKEPASGITEGSYDGGLWGKFIRNKLKRQDNWLDDGRWPANLIHDGSDEVLELFPNVEGPWGKEKSVSKTVSWKQSSKERPIDNSLYQDSGSASRFFICIKKEEGEDMDI